MCSRDDKRFTEKKNKSERARRKKEDTARLRSIVDLALSVDPRIKRIKQEEKEAREAKRKIKGSGANTPISKAQQEEEKRRAEEEAKQKAEEEQVRLLCFTRGFRTLRLTICARIGCKGRGEEGQGSGCQRCEEGSTSSAGEWCRVMTTPSLVSPQCLFVCMLCRMSFSGLCALCYALL